MALSKRQVKGALVSAMEAHLQNWKGRELALFEDIPGDGLAPAIMFHTYEDPDSTDKAFVVGIIAVSSDEATARRFVATFDSIFAEESGQA